MIDQSKNDTPTGGWTEETHDPQSCSDLWKRVIATAMTDASSKDYSDRLEIVEWMGTDYFIDVCLMAEVDVAWVSRVLEEIIQQSNPIVSKAVMYSYRSGCALGSTDKKLLYWVAMLPFFNVALTSEGAVGLNWLVPGQMYEGAWIATAALGCRQVLLVLAFATPVFLAWKVWRSKSGPMPLISLLIVFTNGIWFFVLLPYNAFVWATLFHGIQYLPIVMIFHLKDQKSLGDQRGWLYHTVRFYGMCLALGYALFQCLPHAYMLAGFGLVESALVVAAVINIHHFIVDAYIWRLKKTDTNRRIVDAGAPEVAAAGGQHR